MSANLGFTSTTAPATNFGIRNRISNVSNTASQAGSSVWSFFSSNLFYAGLVLFFLAAIYLYWHYIGYTINSSYTSLVDLIQKRQEGSVGVNLWGDEKPEIGATATIPPPQEAPMSKDDLPAGIPGSRDAPAVSPLDLRNSLMPPRGEVFNVSRNIYTYEDALPVCKALGAELATFEQVQEAHKQGADWCNYGWVKGQLMNSYLKMARRCRLHLRKLTLTAKYKNSATNWIQWLFYRGIRQSGAASEATARP